MDAFLRASSSASGIDDSHLKQMSSGTYFDELFSCVYASKIIALFASAWIEIGIELKLSSFNHQEDNYKIRGLDMLSINYFWLSDKISGMPFSKTLYFPIPNKGDAPYFSQAIKMARLNPYHTVTIWYDSEKISPLQEQKLVEAVAMTNLGNFKVRSIRTLANFPGGFFSDDYSIWFRANLVRLIILRAVLEDNPNAMYLDFDYCPFDVDQSGVVEKLMLYDLVPCCIDIVAYPYSVRLTENSMIILNARAISVLDKLIEQSLRLPKETMRDTQWQQLIKCIGEYLKDKKNIQDKKSIAHVVSSATKLPKVNFCNNTSVYMHCFELGLLDNQDNCR